MLVNLRRLIGPFALAIGVLVSAQAAFAQVQPFVQDFNYNSCCPGPSPVRNNYTGFVGMKFTVGSAPLYVSQLGRTFYPGTGTAFTQNHLLKLVNAQTGVDLPNGSVTVGPNLGGDFFDGGFAYNLLPATLLLPANTSYLLVSQEMAGGDTFYDYTPVTTSGAATLNAAVYADAAGNYIPVANSAGYTYGPVNFKYSTTAPPPTVTITSPTAGNIYTGATITFSANVIPGPGLTISGVQFQLGDSSGHLTNIGPAMTQAPYTLQESTSSLAAGLHTLAVTATDSAGVTATSSVQFSIGAAGGNLITGFSGTVVRNNYSGFVGLEFTTGSAPLTVTSLGRIALGGNTGTHLLKIVQGNQDVAGGQVSITMTPGDGTTFQYAQLPNPLTLSAKTTYLLLSQETSGGDSWYDYSPVSGASGGTTINGAVYSDSSGAYVLVPNTANYSYVPVNFATFVTGGATPGTITITSPANNSVFTTGSITFAASATPAAGLQVSSVQFVLGGANFGSPLTSPPYTLQIDEALIGGGSGSYSLTAVEVDSAGNTTTSAPVNFIAAADNVPLFGSVPIIGNAPTITGQYFGMELTVGAAPLKVSQLGFYSNNSCCSGYALTLSVKLVDAATGLDVPGGSVLATACGFCYSGSFTYANLPSPLTLQANKAYYLLAAQRSPSGLLTMGPVSAGVATVNYPVYQDSNNAYVIATNEPGYSYAPVSLQFESATPIAPVVGITAPAANSAVSGMYPVTFSFGAALPLTVASIQLQVDGVNVNAPVTTGAQLQGLPVGEALDTSAFSNGIHTLTAVATDSNGTQGTSPGITVTFNNSAHGGGSSPAFITSFTPTFLRNNYSGFVGLKFTVGAVPIQISSLGRICVAGNTGSHTVKLVQASNGSDVSGGSVSVVLTGCTAGQFVYASLASPLTLAGSASYYLVDQETVGGDQWYDYAPVTTASAATVNGAVYANGSQWVTVGSASLSYVPLNFLFTSAPATNNPGFGVTLAVGTYTSVVTATVTSALPVASVQFIVDGHSYAAPVTSAPYVLPTVPALNFGTHEIVASALDSSGNTATSLPAFVPFYGNGYISVVNFTGGTLRNNFTGWVGMRLTTGSSPYLTTSLANLYVMNDSIGRFCSAGNSGLHLVKLVNASDGTDVLNAAGWINMAGCAVGSFVNAVLPTNVALSANTSYYLVSQEVNGGDSWYDVSPVVPLASVSTPVPPLQSNYGFFGWPTGANFTIDGPVYSAANGSLVFVPSPNNSFVGLSIGGYSPVTCRGEGYACGP